jgi:hypothetical protein
MLNNKNIIKKIKIKKNLKQKKKLLKFNTNKKI